MASLGVCTVSLASLFYELLLSYYFAEAQWSNLYFFVISISLFGYSAGGIIVNALTGSKHRTMDPKPLTSLCLIIFSAGVLGSYLVVNHLTLDYFRLPFEPKLLFLLAFQYLVLAVPFTAAGIIIAAAFATAKERTHRVYSLSMAGSALGVASALVILSTGGVESGVLFCAFLPVISQVFGSSAPLSRRIPSGLLAATCIVLALTAPVFFQVRLSSYKSLAILLDSKDTEVLESRDSLHGRIDILQSPSLRSVLGLSLTFQGEVPFREAVILNAENLVFLGSSQKASPASTASLPAAAGFLRRPCEKALVLRQGDGSALTQAIASGCREIHLAEPFRELAALQTNRTQHPAVKVLPGTPRSGEVLSGGPYDLIYLDDPGSSLPGLRSLDETYHLTVEAFSAYLHALSSDGIIILTRRLHLPPTDSVRIFSTALEALKTAGEPRPEEHLLMLRNWNAYSLLISRSLFTPEEQEAVKTFAEDLLFDPVYAPRLSAEETNRFNCFDKPFHYQALQDNLKGTEDAVFNTRPAHDRKPYAYSFLRLRNLKEAKNVFGSRRHLVLVSGDILVWFILATAVAVAALFLLLPLIPYGRTGKRVKLSSVFYFSLLGAAFMFTETGLIKLYTLATGDSLISFSLVLSTVLIASAAGSYWGRNLPRPCLSRLIPFLGLLLLGTGLFGFPLLRLLLDLKALPRLLIMLPCIALPCVGMGIPFPAGMKYLTPTSPERAYAWSANGVFSVLSSIASMPVSLYLGIPALFVLAGGAYLAAGPLIRVSGSKP